MSVTTRRKAGSDPRLSNFSSTASRTLARVWDTLMRSLDETAVNTALDHNNYEGAIAQIVDRFATGLGDMIALNYHEAGHHFSADVAEATMQHVSFDPTSHQAVKDARDLRHYFGEDLNTFREALRRVVTRGLADQQNDIASSMIGAMGLTPRDLDAIENYSQALAANDKMALRTDLRDRRYDRSVRGGNLTVDQMGRMVQAKIKMTKQVTRDRIITTQVHRLVNTGRHALLLQHRDNIVIGNVKRTWQGSKTSERHGGLVGQTVGLDQPFVTDKGQQIRFPGDPFAPPELTINCQCWLRFDF